MGDQILEQQELKDRYPHLRNLPNQSYNLNDVQVILGQDCYDNHHPFEFKKSDDEAAPWAVKSKIGWALSGPLPAKQAATLATTATSIADEKVVGYRVLRFKLRCHRTFKGRATSNQDVGANNAIQR